MAHHIFQFESELQNVLEGAPEASRNYCNSFRGRQAESVVAALSMSVIAETEYARSEQFDNQESIYRACADMKLFNQEVLRVILLGTRYRYSSTVEITKGSINESLAYPRHIFRPVIGQSAYASSSRTTTLPVIRRLAKMIPG